MPYFHNAIIKPTSPNAISPPDCCQYPIPVANAQLDIGNIGTGNTCTLATFNSSMGDSPLQVPAQSLSCVIIFARRAPSALDAAKAAYGALSADEREAFRKWLAEQG